MRDGTEVHPKSAGDREGFEWGLSRFLDEARTLARFEHPNVVRVRDCFEANNTAYIVMDYEDDEPLDALLRRHGTLSEAQLKRVLLPVADGLRQVHAAGFLHRDIKPSNIFVRRSDESPVLLDFGSARQALSRRSRSVTAIASAGYSPPEQYESRGAQGAWTDIYALSALCYRAITGDAPMEATGRQSQLLRSQTDPLPKLAETPAAGYSPAFLEAADWGLRVIETERPQSLDEWLPWLDSSEAGDASAAKSRPKGDRRRGRRKSGGVILVGAAALSVSVWLALYFTLDQRLADPEPDQAPPAAAYPVATQSPQTNEADRLRADLELRERERNERVADARNRLAGLLQRLEAGTANKPSAVTSVDGAPEKRTESTADAPASPDERTTSSTPEGPLQPRAEQGTSETQYNGKSAATELTGHGSAPTMHRPVLLQLEHPFAVATEPPYAQVQLLDHTEPYRPGNALTAGFVPGEGERRRLRDNHRKRNARCGAGRADDRAPRRYRLLAESEWEYVARAGTATTYSWGDAIGACRASCYSCGCQSDLQIVQVGSFAANAWGLHDMHGNASEVVEDCWNGSYAGAPLDGSAWRNGDCTKRVLRGGSSLTRPRSLRVTSRVKGRADRPYFHVGFRVARTLAL